MSENRVKTAIRQTELKWINPINNAESPSNKGQIPEAENLKYKNMKISKMHLLDLSPSPVKLKGRRDVRRMLSFASPPESDFYKTPINNESFPSSSPGRKIIRSYVPAIAKNSLTCDKSDYDFSPLSCSNVRQEPNVSLLVERFQELGRELQVWSHEDRQYTIDRIPVLSTILEEGTQELPPEKSEENVPSTFRVATHSSLNLCVRL